MAKNGIVIKLRTWTSYEKPFGLVSECECGIASTPPWIPSWQLLPATAISSKYHGALNLLKCRSSYEHRN